MDRKQDLEVVSQAGSVAEGRQRMAEGGIDTAIVDVPLPDEGAKELWSGLYTRLTPPPGPGDNQPSGPTDPAKVSRGGRQ